jgi:prephenate dehydrogenase
MKINLTVIGLDRTGVSIGLALGKKGAEMQRTGFDLDQKKVEAVKNYQAFDQVTVKLIDAVKLADLVLIDLPLDEVKDLFTKVASWIKKDAVLIYFSALPSKVADWAKQLLPENVYFVALTPSINPKYIEDVDQSTPHADLFENSQMLISHLPSIPPKVIQIAADLTALMGATPCFADLAEVDGLQTIAQFLPRISATAVMDEVMNEPGWKDASKLAGDDLANTTRLLNSILDENQGQVLIDNQENSLRVIANLQNSLGKLAQIIHAGDSQKLQDYLDSLRMERENWLGKRRNIQPKKKNSVFGRK